MPDRRCECGGKITTASSEDVRVQICLMCGRRLVNQTPPPSHKDVGTDVPGGGAA
jgi:hypothetical protein